MSEDAIATAASVTSAIAAVGNITLFSSQIPLVYRLAVHHKDSTNYDYLPSLTLMTTLSLWCGYTVWVLPTPQLFAANFPGMILPFFYLLFFAYYSKTSFRRWKILLLTFIALGATWGISAGVYSTNLPEGTNIGGGITAAVNFTFFLSPLRQLRRAVKERTLIYTPTLLSFVQFFQALMWVIAAALLKDWFIFGVNFAGWIFAMLQLGVIFYVRSLQKQVHHSSTTDTAEEEKEKETNIQKTESHQDTNNGRDDKTTIVVVEAAVDRTNNVLSTVNGQDNQSILPISSSSSSPTETSS